jgi:hypothetical protein
MKFHAVEPGSDDWLDKRKGIPCTSGFQNIVTPLGARTSGKRRVDYMNRLIAERLLGYSMESTFETIWTLRGRELEPQAARAFADEYMVTLEPGGFITTDDGRAGCSPDRLVRSQRGRGPPYKLREGLELKCPAPWTQVGYLLQGGVSEHYRQQVQGQLFVGEFDVMHLWSFHPQMPPAYVVTVRDAKFIARLAEELDLFCDQLDAETEKARKLGVFTPGREPPASAGRTLDLPGVFPWREGDPLQ